jgi:hypothetical protein
MATATQVGYQRAARKRWPAARIDGTGSFALVSYCCEDKYVRLYETHLEAYPLVAQRCPHAFCKGEHRLYRIAVQEETQPVYQAAHAVGYGRD